MGVMVWLREENAGLNETAIGGAGSSNVGYSVMNDDELN